MEKPYRLPDPEKQPDSFLVILYKTLRNVPYDDRSWDKHYFARGMKRAQELLEVFKGDVRLAAQCMKDLKEEFEADGLGWTIETIISRSFDWRSKHANINSRDCLLMFANAYKAAGVDPKVLAIAPPPEIKVVPVCAHPGYKPKPGKEWVCECGERIYQPTPDEMQTFKTALNPKKVSA